MDAVNWIMGCVESTNFEILVNGKLSIFFRSLRDL